ncbi:MAG: NifU family protein [Fimbriimonadales bacterium]|nr:NifU family protein [Fimbriimonadales bacterium]
MDPLAFRKKSRTEVEKRVEERLKTVQAYAISHCGRIELVSATEDGVIKIRLRGACAYCPIAPVTLKHGVEDQLRIHIPEFTRIEVV